ncbi:MAG: hypothetical protein AAFQ43_12750, partial [Bacteroidota bacterium]
MSRLILLALAVSLAASATAQDLAASPVAVRTALDHVRSQTAVSALTSADVADLAVSSAHTSRRSGLTYVYVQQRIEGVDIAGSIVTVAVGRDGRVAHAAGELSASTAVAAKALSLTAEAALARAAALVGEPAPARQATRSLGGAERRTAFGSVAGTDVEARLVYEGATDRGLRLAWEVTVPTRDAQHIWVVRVDAQTGEELSWMTRSYRE